MLVASGDRAPLEHSLGLIWDGWFTNWEFPIDSDPRLHDLQLSCSWASPLCILVLYGELIPSSFLNKPPTSQISASSLLSSPSNGLEINNREFTVFYSTQQDFLKERKQLPLPPNSWASQNSLTYTPHAQFFWSNPMSCTWSNQKVK